MRYYYRSVSIKNNYIKVILILYSLITIFFIIALAYSNSDKYYYCEYKKYEVKIQKKCDAIISNADNTTSSYYLGKITKKKMMTTLKYDSSQLMSVYDNFLWSEGDTETKELYTLKREIILGYARIYDSRVKAATVGITYSETDENEYIKSLTDRYYDVDTDEKEKLNMN